MEVRFVFVVVDTIDEKWSIILWWSRDDDFFDSISKMLLGSLGGKEFSGTLHDSIDSVFTPWDFSWIHLGVESDFLSVDYNTVFIRFNTEGESKMG